MPFFPVIGSTDTRSQMGLVPMTMRNVMYEPQAEGAQTRNPLVLIPTFGSTLRVTPAALANARGIYCKPGVQGGALFAVMGEVLYQVDVTWSATVVGAIPGTGRVLLDSIGANLYVLSLSTGVLYEWDGATLTANADVDFSPNAYTLASLADRLLSNTEGSDQFDWSATGDGLNWPADGFAASARYPDPIEQQIELGGDLWHFGRNSTQVWRAVGATDAEAFDILTPIVINRGIIGRDAIARMDSGALFVGDDRVLYELSGYTPQRLVNRDVETALKALSAADAAAISCLSYAHGSHLTGIVRPPTGAAYAFDALMRAFSERTTYDATGTTTFAPAYYANFNGAHVWAASDRDGLYTWDGDAYSDAGDPIERVMSLHVRADQNIPISNITLQMRTFGQPVTGQGSAPQAMVSFWRDGGNANSLQQIGIERVVGLGATGTSILPTIWRLGMINAANGLIIKIRITDPVGFAFSGLWVNELPR